MKTRIILKPKYLFILLFCLSYVGIYSQTHQQFIGVKSGIVISNVNSMNDNLGYFKNTKYKIGFIATITYDYQINDYLIIESGFNYTQKGFYKEMSSLEDADPSYDSMFSFYKYDYLSIPIEMKIQKGNKFMFSCFIGFAPNYLINSQFYYSVSKNSTSVHIIDMTEKVTKFDISGNIGIGASYLIKNKFKLGLDIGYNHSFLTITNHDYYENIKVTHYYFNAILGLKYMLNHKDK